eukprot:GHUV01040169.1.p1 GENE.GHUV01040169.1~~GHUV01040169.1.p1  ORF type:complete len:271 (+),score=88.80 GHUV01040169.1:45-815(+)
MVEIMTSFVIPAPAAPDKRAGIQNTVIRSSSNILERPLTTFFGVPPKIIDTVQPLDAAAAAADDMELGMQAPYYQAGNITINTAAAGSSKSNSSGGSKSGSTSDRNSPVVAGTHGAAAAVEDPAAASATAGYDPTQPVQSVIRPSAGSPAQQPRSADTLRSDHTSGSGSDHITRSGSGSDQTTRIDQSVGSPPVQGSVPDQSQPEAESYATAPTCNFAPTMTNSVVDGEGRFWGQKDGKQCVFKPLQGPFTKVSRL